MPSLNWIGKEAVTNHDKAIPFRLLKKIKAASVGIDSENLIIHGDNLEALKALMPYYHGKIKCIYIDPPYNTGNEGWIYNDKVNSPKIKKWLKQTVKSDDLTRHDKWLCMIYPRLKLLRDLLSEDGVLFISIDDNELNSLHGVMNEIFGENRFIGNLVWYKKRKGSFLSKTLVSLTEYILVYKKSSKSIPLLGSKPDRTGSQPLVKRTNSRKILSFEAGIIKTRLKDGKYKKGLYGIGSSAINLIESVTIKNGLILDKVKLEGPFIWTQTTLDEALLEGAQITINTNNFQPRVIKIFKEEEHKGLPSFIDGREFSATNDDAYEDIKEIFQEEKIFNYSKPKNLLSYLINAATFQDKNAIILDSFAGSGTTGHAVLDLNKVDGGTRKFIMVEMEDHVAKDITAERIKRVIKKYNYKDGFEYCELGKPLFDETGHIEKTCDFNQFATYIYFTETQRNIDQKEIEGNFIGQDTNIEFYLIYKALKTNNLDKAFIKKLRKTENKKIIYADRCLLDDETLTQHNIVFKQIPYEVKIY